VAAQKQQQKQQPQQATPLDAPAAAPAARAPEGEEGEGPTLDWEAALESLARRVNSGAPFTDASRKVGIERLRQGAGEGHERSDHRAGEAFKPFHLTPPHPS
jgi:hypothetical protein